MTYHITYTDRLTQRIETGRVGIAKNPLRSAAELRREAIKLAAWKYPNARRSSISAVRISR